MGVKKVVYGDRTLIDLSSDTVTSKTLLSGKTAHNKTGDIVTGEYVRPLIINGRVVKQIFLPTTYNGADSRYAGYTNECVKIDTLSMYASSANNWAYFECCMIGMSYWTTTDYTFSLGTMRLRCGGSETQPTLIWEMPVTKYGVAIAAQTLYNAEASSESFSVSLIKMNDRAYLLLYMRDYTTEYGKESGISCRVIYDTGTAIAISGGTGISSGWAHTATTTSYYKLYLMSLNKDNTQFGILRFNEVSKDDGTGYTTSQSYYNNYRVKSPATVGLRSTSWTNMYNNAAYYCYLLMIMPEVGFYMEYYTNAAQTTWTNYFMSNVMGDYYGAQVNATASMASISPYLTEGVGAFLNDEDYLHLSGFKLSNGLLKASYQVVIPFGKTTRTNMRTVEMGEQNVTLLDLSTLANICKPVYDNRNDSMTKFRSAKFIDRMLIVFISVLKDIHSNMSGTTYSSVEDNLYAIGLYYNMATKSWQVVGAARGGSYRNDNFLGFSNAKSYFYIGDLFERERTGVFDQGYDFDTGTRYNRTYNDIRNNWEYEPWHQYVIEYRDSAGGQQN